MMAKSNDLKLWWRLTKAWLGFPGPQYLIAFINGACNLSCDNCCDAATSVRKTPELDPTHWRGALDGLHSLVHLTLTGGEPFLRNDLSHLVQEMLKATKVPRLSINSNGFYTLKTVQFVQDFYHLTAPTFPLSINISLDGTEDLHDKLRGARGSYANAIRTLKELIYLKQKFPGLEVRAASLLQFENSETLENLFEKTDQMGLDFHEIILLRDIEPREQEKLLPLYERLTRRQLKSYKMSLLSRTLEKAMISEVQKRVKRKKDLKCSAGKNFLEILPDGRVLGCEMKKVEGSNLLGNIQKNSVKEISQSQKTKRFREEIASKCHCSFECSITSDLLFQKHNWPKFLRS